MLVARRSTRGRHIIQHLIPCGPPELVAMMIHSLVQLCLSVYLMWEIDNVHASGTAVL